jgi:uncharacterized membrane protein YcaP (DUF421 family)
MDGLVSSFGIGKAVLEGLFRALGPLPSTLLLFVVFAAIAATYNFIQLRKSRVRSLSDTHASPVIEKDRTLNKNRELGGGFE